MPLPDITRRRKGPHEAIMAATFNLLVTEGYAKMTMESIARSAKVGKPTLYRWWNSKAEIVLEAAILHAEETLPPPDTGSMRGDFCEYFLRLFTLLNAGGGLVARSLVAEASMNREFAESFRDSFVAARRLEIVLLLGQGKTRGEIATDLPAETVIDCFFGPVWYRLILFEALDEKFAKELSDLLCDGVLSSR